MLTKNQSPPSHLRKTYVLIPFGSADVPSFQTDRETMSPQRLACRVFLVAVAMLAVLACVARGADSKYAAEVFRAMDKDQNGAVTVEECGDYLVGLRGVVK